ncbi:polyphosphoinositide phosphatase-like [Hydractinia symbiolongicarpus]|uniref:polyphosphoinositide phosphatase-like n=1 Tax=Hydractinia symbiolongicarpus TaxID=13093 RepID=UPI00254F8E54|nr:polyphosphoinositide phosphatase-like [Hydractinia symbiolongicarpus]
MENELTDIIHPICCTQKIAVYETKSRFYLVGSNNSQTRFRILKIDRTEPTEINIIDDKVEYNNWEIRDVLHRIDVGNRPKSAKYDKGSVGLVHRGSAFGILGFVRFLEGYYVVLISKRRRVALIGGHTIYKVDDVDVIPIANEQAKAKMGNPDETRYLRIFMNVDLSSNFYFSYSYDLTRTLQYNMAPYYGLPLKSSSVEMKDNLSGEAGTEIEDGASSDEISDKIEENVEDSKDIDMEAIFSSRSSSSMELSSLSANVFPNIGSPPPECSPRSKIKTKVFRGTPTDKYVWNSHILEGLKDEVHPDWLLNIIHGFVGQSNICVYVKPLYVTLIARRSKKFAGTRFLKRGTNDEGFVANDVETEQICHDASVISLRSGRYTSYVQIRGSAPFFWSQDTIQGRITPKPQILVDRADPYFTSTGSHFNALMSRYGAPLIILNLVKIKEKKPHEQILSGLLKESIDYLNQFLPFPHKMQYTAWDMARVTKSKEDKVIEILAEIAESKVKETGFFHSGPQLFCNKLRNNPSFADMKGFGYNSEHPGLKQTGILRVNCVDCLDRTNTAQFMVGKCALGFQLYALGVTESPVLQFDSDAVRMLEELFEAHGDTLALQYGGSQMVHRIRTYRKIAPWTSYSRDIMQTVSRYYSNAFTDTDKQQAINLFLGTFQPHEKLPNIWDIPTDYYLHHSSTTNLEQHSVRQSYTKWWHDEVISALPFAWEEIAKKKMIEEEQHSVHDDEETMDLFAEYYRPAEMTEIDGLYQKTMPTSTKDFMPSSSADPSPFVVRARGRTQDDSPQVSHRHAIGGQPVTLEDSSDEESLSDDDRSGMQSPLKINPRDTLTPTDLLGERWPTPRLFRDQIKEPTPDDIELYRRYSEISQSSSPVKPRVNLNLAINWPPSNKYPPNSTLQVEVPVVDKASLSTYEEYCKVGKYGPTYPCNMNMNIYHNYVGQNYM